MVTPFRSRRWLVVLLVSFLTGACAHSNITRPNRAFTNLLDCDHDEVVAAYEDAQERLKDEGLDHWEPQVGWSACTLLAHLGVPGRHGPVRQGNGFKSMLFWYYFGDDTQLVILRFDEPDGPWIVSGAP